MGEMQNANAAEHSLVIDRRRHAVITGVADVNSFHETEVVLKIATGVMVIGGQELHIGRLNLEEGKLDIAGRIDSVVYEGPSASARLFGFWNKKK